MTDCGSGIKKKQKSLAVATNHPDRVGNDSLIGWFILLIQTTKVTCSLVAFATYKGDSIKEGARFGRPF
ncbi:hypothetical protein [Prochlorococcus marinus]|uniref:hypothetical protein n=1 Tax=Prochlorococcus marinus TaxID=1219 RepID=UPI0022B4A6CE|nr:hypothetical protein [Prochlorococcus marinus]